MQYGFIGCGNMGSALAKALSQSTTDIVLSDRSGKAKAVAADLGCQYDTPQAVAAGCQRIFLGVKPQMMAQVLRPLQPVLAERKPLLITMAAGLTMAQIQEMAGSPLPVVRIMPNTPVAVGKGLVLYCANELVDPAVLEEILQDMRFCGTLDATPEHLFDAAGTVSGCGPAYGYLFLEAMADGAVACGVPRAKALEYAAAALAGAAEMVRTTGQHPGALKDAVCSPGGSTIAGIRVLERGGFRSNVTECIVAACEKNKALGK